jgi:hypothetical protein
MEQICQRTPIALAGWISLTTPQNPLIIIASLKKQRGYGVLSPAGNLLYHQQHSRFLTQPVFLYRVIILFNNYELPPTGGSSTVLT